MMMTNGPFRTDVRPTGGWPTIQIIRDRIAGKAIGVQARTGGLPTERDVRRRQEADFG